MPEKLYKIYTQNPQFSGIRNAGSFSTLFVNGRAEVDEDTAKLFVANFKYFCPQLFPEHAEQVAELYEVEKKGESEDPTEVAKIDGKVEIEFDTQHKIGKNEYKPGDRSIFKRAYAEKLIQKKIAHYSTSGESGE